VVGLAVVEGWRLAARHRRRRGRRHATTRLAFRTPITITEAVARISRHEYVLPAIQRPFVWTSSQICTLFDSVIEGYPIGSFLFWKIDKQNADDHVVYPFVCNYHARDQVAMPRLSKRMLPDGDISAVLDGQQRLAGLYIGLSGSYTERGRGCTRGERLFYKKVLCLNLRAAPRSRSAAGLVNNFQFLTEEMILKCNSGDNGVHWFRVSDLMKFPADRKFTARLFEYVRNNGMAEHPHAFDQLNRLFVAIHTLPLLYYFEEQEQDPDKILNIFIRVNNGGTTLSRTDLLVSLATARWRDLNARDEVMALIADLHKVDSGGDFTRRLVLVAALYIVGSANLTYSVKNFTPALTHMMESRWGQIRTSVLLAVRLMTSMGWHAGGLSRSRVVAILASYLMARNADESYLDSPKFGEDRDNVRHWFIRIMIKKDWRVSDRVVIALRDVIQDKVSSAAEPNFPAVAFDATMRSFGFSLAFDDDEVDVLFSSRLTHKRALPLLALLYPMPLCRSEVHVDHIFPKSVAQGACDAESLSLDVANAIRGGIDSLPNLWLLTGPQNLHKSSKLPADWVGDAIADEAERKYFLARHDIDELPTSLEDFPRFVARRRERMVRRLRGLLNGQPDEPSGDEKGTQRASDSLSQEGGILSQQPA